MLLVESRIKWYSATELHRFLIQEFIYLPIIDNTDIDEGHLRNRDHGEAVSSFIFWTQGAGIKVGKNIYFLGHSYYFFFLKHSYGFNNTYFIRSGVKTGQDISVKSIKK